MREEILQLGGTFEFENCVTDIRVENQKIKAVEINHNTWMETEVCVLALGHSARDTFEMLQKTGLFMEPKAFAVGVSVGEPTRGRQSVFVWRPHRGTSTAASMEKNMQNCLRQHLIK